MCFKQNVLLVLLTQNATQAYNITKAKLKAKHKLVLLKLLLVKVASNNLMQKVVNNKTHVFVFELESILICTSETSHVFQIGGRNR